MISMTNKKGVENKVTYQLPRFASFFEIDNDKCVDERKYDYV